MGHLLGLATTAEGLHRVILGCRQRGTPQERPFDHTTGEGHVPFHKGDYYDARHVKRNQVVPLIVEALGGIGRRGALPPLSRVMRTLLCGGGAKLKPMILLGGGT